MERALGVWLRELVLRLHHLARPFVHLRNRQRHGGEDGEEGGDGGHTLRLNGRYWCATRSPAYKEHSGKRSAACEHSGKRSAECDPCWGSPIIVTLIHHSHLDDLEGVEIVASWAPYNLYVGGGGGCCVSMCACTRVCMCVCEAAIT